MITHEEITISDVLQSQVSLIFKNSLHLSILKVIHSIDNLFQSCVIFIFDVQIFISKYSLVLVGYSCVCVCVLIGGLQRNGTKMIPIELYKKRFIMLAWLM